MSDHSSPPRSSTRGTTDRRAALDRRKDASSSKARLSKGQRPTFLGAEDDDDAFDFEAFSRPSASTRTRKERETTATNGGDALGSGFDDLFNLDGPDASRVGVDDEALKGDLADLDADAGPVKKRKVVAKMDETRLLGTTGFPKLMQDIKRVKLKGKGHETQDLKRVLSMYQLWTHQMYAKTNLRDTLATVEKLCHKRSLQRGLKTYKDEWKNGKAASGSIPEFEEDPEARAAREARQAEEEDEDGEESGIFAGLNKKGSQSQKGKGKEGGGDIFNQDDLDDLFGDDDDALMAALEAEALGTTAGGRGASTSESAPARSMGTTEVDKSALRPEANEEYDGIEEDQVPEEEDDEAMAAMREMEELLA